MNAAVLTFAPSGEGQCLYTELIDLASLGSLEITRATSVEFNNPFQHWEVKQDGRVIFHNRSRAVCLAWEHQQFNR